MERLDTKVTKRETFAPASELRGLIKVNAKRKKNDYYVCYDGVRDVRVTRALKDGSFSAMCDYSLHDVTSRPAKVGDELVTTEFWNTTTRGFSPVGEPKVAVCLLPGTEVVFESEVQRRVTGFQLSFFKRELKPLGHKVARFRQVNLDNPHTHHDALEFPDGQMVLLTHLLVGQHASVLQLPVQAKSPVEAETQVRVASVG